MMMALRQHLNAAGGYLLLCAQKRDRTDRLLRVLFLSLQAVDLILTLVAARYGFPELNPIVRQSLGMVFRLAAFKFVVPALISIIVPGRFLLPSIILLGMVLGWNIKELLLLAF
ncbi:MAG: DUF5658 family protein [Dehalococcoidales bacterium]|nr:DUF5658 family protein [Dehalococcoidales bacterium]